jgi:hypothetical protein
LNKDLKLSINYVSNFNFLDIFNKKKINRVGCKKFILFIFFFNYLNIRYTFFKKITLFVKPKYFNTQTILRAPYRYKLSRDQLTFSRHHIICSFLFKNFLNFIILNKINDLFILLNIFKKLFPLFESNICFQKKIKIYFNFFFKTNFLVLNYKL